MSDGLLSSVLCDEGVMLPRSLSKHKCALWGTTDLQFGTVFEVLIKMTILIKVTDILLCTCIKLYWRQINIEERLLTWLFYITKFTERCHEIRQSIQLKKISLQVYNIHKLHCILFSHTNLLSSIFIYLFMCLFYSLDVVFIRST